MSDRDDVKQAPRWRKKPGTGRHIMPDKTVVGEGKVIRAYRDELRNAVDKFIPLDPVEDRPAPEPSTLKLVSDGTGKYNVVDSRGRNVNDAPLSQEQAEALLNGTLPEADADAGAVDDSESAEEADADSDEPALSDEDKIKLEISAMLATGRNLTKDGKPELPVLRARVHNNHGNEIVVTDEIRDRLFEEIQSGGGEAVENTETVA